MPSGCTPGQSRQATIFRVRRANRSEDAMPRKKMNETVSLQVEISRAAERGKRVAARTAATISKALDKMVADLGEFGSTHMTTLHLVRELTYLQPARMQLIMDDHGTREAYEASLAEIPATPGRTDF
jgi:hypothetical protein